MSLYTIPDCMPGDNVKSDPNLVRPSLLDILLLNLKVYFDLLKRTQETECLMITHEKKYYHQTASNGEETFVKRSLVHSEYMTNLMGKDALAVMLTARWKTEGAANNFYKQHTKIPVPNIRCAFEDNGRYHIMTDVVPSIDMA